MSRALPSVAPRRWLLACAASSEGHAIARAFEPGAEAPRIQWKAVQIDSHLDLLVTGVGKANAAAAVARALDPARHAGVINLGICGMLPKSRLKIGDIVLASRSIYADEGVQTPQGFLDIARQKFPPNQGLPGAGRIDAPISNSLLTALTPLAVRVAPIATVSTCSGRNRLALSVVQRTGSAAEAMEGAAIGFTVLRLAHECAAELAFAELRIVSNTTGNRARQRWDLAGSLARLGELAARL